MSESNITLADGTVLAPFPPEEKQRLEAEFGEFLSSREAVMIPCLAKDLTGLHAEVRIYKRVAQEKEKDAENTDAEAAQGGQGDSGEQP